MRRMFVLGDVAGGHIMECFKRNTIPSNMPARNSCGCEDRRDAMTITNNFDSPYPRDTHVLHATRRLRFPPSATPMGKREPLPTKAFWRRQAFILPQNLGRIHQDQTI